MKNVWVIGWNRFSCGTQNEWITSPVVATIVTGVRAGMWISLAVTAPVPG